MLVLSRKPQERIFIGDDIIVTVLESDCNKVRLGIDAPTHINIVREELVCKAISVEMEKESQRFTS